MSEETKGAARSKINLTGIILVILGAITDPMFRQYFGDLIPAEWFGRITFMAGWAVIYFRSNGQANIPVDWKNPWKGLQSVILIGLLSVCLTACATVSAIKSDATPKETAQAICSDMQTTITAASALVAWTSLYFPNQKTLLAEVSEYLSLAEESRAAACAAVDLVVDTESLSSLVTTKQSAVLTLIGKVNAIITKIKGTSSSSVEYEFRIYKFEAACLDPRLPGINGTSVARSAANVRSPADVGMCSLLAPGM